MAKKADNEVYVRLKNTAGSFYDMQQGKSVVAHRIVLMRKTPNIIKAIDSQTLIVVDEDEALRKIPTQDDKHKNPGTAPATPVKKTKTLIVEDDDDEEEEVTKASKKGTKVEETKTTKKVATKKAITDDDDETEEK